VYDSSARNAYTFKNAGSGKFLIQLKASTELKDAGINATEPRCRWLLEMLGDGVWSGCAGDRLLHGAMPEMATANAHATHANAHAAMSPARLVNDVSSWAQLAAECAATPPSTNITLYLSPTFQMGNYTAEIQFR
jgi:hypothetical protein